jgi:hypothetical protein
MNTNLYLIEKQDNLHRQQLVDEAAQDRIRAEQRGTSRYVAPFIAATLKRLRRILQLRLTNTMSPSSPIAKERR